MPSPHARGRRPAGSGTKAAIEASARRLFSELGYPRTTIRAIAADAGVDPRLISHFFGSKQQLFVTVVELPFDPETTFDRLLAGGGEDAGRRLAEFLLALLENPHARSTLTGIMRAAASEEAAAAQIRDLIATRLLTALARHFGAEEPELRASMMASQIVGLTFVRHVVGVPALQNADRTRLIAYLSQVFNLYLHGLAAANPPPPKARAADEG
jgi:AcrR family transcriptional regulator